MKCVLWDSVLGPIFVPYLENILYSRLPYILLYHNFYVCLEKCSHFVL